MKTRIAVLVLVLLAALLLSGPHDLLTAASTPQEPPKLPPFNVPIICPDGKTYVVLECHVRGRLEMCTYT